MRLQRAPGLFVAALCLGLAGCTTTPTSGPTQLIDFPLASAHSDIAFALTTVSWRSLSCATNAGCPNGSASDAPLSFSLQVRRIANSLQNGARKLYPDLEQRVPRLAGGRFDVYVIDGDEPGSTSSANGRIALNSALNSPNAGRQPNDEWLAFIIAREMGHVIARHHEENSVVGMITSVLLNIIVPGSGLLKSAISTGGSSLAARSKKDEQAIEADAIAVKLLYAAGFRRRDIAQSLVAMPLLDDSEWSQRFRKSSGNLIADIRNADPPRSTARHRTKQRLALRGATNL